MTLPAIEKAVAECKAIADEIHTQLVSAEDGTHEAKAWNCAYLILDLIDRDLTPAVALEISEEFSKIADVLGGKIYHEHVKFSGNALLAAFTMDSVASNVAECDDIVSLIEADLAAA